MNRFPTRGVCFLSVVLATWLLLPGGWAADSKFSEREQRELFKDEVRKLALAGEFDRLEAAAEDFRQKKSRYPNGYLHLRAFYSAFSLSDKVPDAEWEKLIATLKSWCDQKKESPTPRVALAETYAGYAWKARTGDTADKVTEEGWAGMRSRLAQASEILSETKKLTKQCPGWYPVMQRIALGTSMPRNEYDALFEEGVKNAGYYDPLYEARAYFLLPRWYGQRGEWEQFAKEAMARPDVPDAEEIFAKAALFLNSLRYLTAEFSRSAESWDALKRSFTALQKHYPGSLEVASVFCKVAATIPDLATAREQWRLVGGRFDPSCWTAVEFAAVGKALGNVDATAGLGSLAPPAQASSTSGLQRFNPTQHIQKDADGSIWLKEVPVAARREKNYSLITSVDRVARYYFGMQVNESELAQLAEGYIASGARFSAGIEFLKSMEARWKLRLREHQKADTNAIKELMRDYNRAAKRAKVREIAEQRPGQSLSDIYGAMDPKVLKEARTQNPAGMGRFLRDVQASINAGIPLLWTAQMGLVKEPNPPIPFGAQVRLIIGYNTKAQEIVYSDSSGSERMKLDDAWTITHALMTLEPIN